MHVQLKPVFHQVQSMLDQVLFLQRSNLVSLRWWNWSNAAPFHQAVCKCNCAWRANALEYFADLLAEIIFSFGIPLHLSSFFKACHKFPTTILSVCSMYLKRGIWFSRKTYQAGVIHLAPAVSRYTFRGQNKEYFCLRIACFAEFLPRERYQEV